MLSPRRAFSCLLVTISLAAVAFVLPAPAAQAATKRGPATPEALCQPVTGTGPLPSTSGGFHAMTPERVLDTRATTGMVPAGCTAAVDLSAVVPAEATAVSLDVVAVDSAQAGFVTVYPCGSTRPLASNLNTRIGDATPNAVVMPIDGTRRACLYTDTATQLVVDVTGWFGPGGQPFNGVGPDRLIDTRTDPLPDGGSGPVAGGTVLRLPVAGQSGIPQDASGVVVNLTATGPVGDGYLTAFPCGTAVPLASTGNYLAGETRANQAFVGLGNGDLCIYTPTTTDLVVDVSGWFGGTSEQRASAIVGTRVLDTRNGTGGRSTPLQPGETVAFDPTLQGTLPVGAAAVLDVVATGATTPGWLTVYPCDGSLPPTSSVNYAPGQDVANAVVMPLAADGSLCVRSEGATDVVVDVNASFGAAGALRSLSASLGPLMPAFSPDGHDYGVICPAGGGTVTVQATPVPMGQVSVGGGQVGVPVAVNEDQLIDVVATRFDGTKETYHLRCLPHDFPVYQVSRPDDPTPGWRLLNSGIGAPSGGTFAVILDDHGAAVWYRRTNGVRFDSKLLPDGNIASVPFLGATFGTDPNGAYEERDLDGNLVRTWSAVGTPTDQHDMGVLPNGDKLMISYHQRPGVDTTALGAGYGASETVMDGWIQEVTPAGVVVWEWHSQDHIGITETVAQQDGVNIVYSIPNRVVDLLHINSVDLDPTTGDVIVSARHLDAVMRIRRDPGQPDDGKVVWKLGGAPPADPGAQHLTVVGDPFGGPARQHDARLQGSVLSLFDNRTNTGSPSRAVEYRLDLQHGTATMLWQFANPLGLTPFGLGSYRHLADGSRIIGWGGSPPLFTELGPWGTPTLQVAQSPAGLGYRVVKEPPEAFDPAVLRAAAHG